MRIEEANFIYPNAGITGPKDVLISSTVASGAAAVDLSLPGGFDYYIVKMKNVTCGTDGVIVQARVSYDNGTTFQSTVGDYAWVAYVFSSAGVTATGDNSDGEMQLTRDGTALLGNVAGETFEMILHIYNVDHSFNRVMFSGLSLWDASNGNANASGFAGRSLGYVEEEINAIRFFMSSGTISGTFDLIGVKR